MEIVQLYSFQPLFLKPLHYPGDILFQRFSEHLEKTISFRSFNLETDLGMIHDWVNKDYAFKYWQLEGSIQRVHDLYYNIQRNSNGHSYIGLLNEEPICQFDVYRVLADEIRQYVQADENDCGFHLLMAPNDKPVPGLSLTIVQTFLEYYFSFPNATRMFAEPDIRNNRSNRLLIKTGFNLIESIEMSYKTANLYSITKEQFHAANTKL